MDVLQLEPLTVTDADLAADAGFLLDWSKGRPITAAGSDSHSPVAGDWYQCGDWRVRLWPSTVHALLTAGLAVGTPNRFAVRRWR